MIFDLVKDFAEVLAAIPQEHPRYRMLKLLDEAIRRDVHFIDRHPTTLFQCLWNAADRTESASAQPLQEFWSAVVGPRWRAVTRRGSRIASKESSSDALTDLSRLVNEWREMRRKQEIARPWLRSLRPPDISLGQGQWAVLTGHAAPIAAIAISPDGTRLASASSDGVVRIWNLSTTQCACEFRIGSATGLAFSRDQAGLAALGKDGIVRIHNSHTGIALAQIALEGTPIAISLKSATAGVIYYHTGENHFRYDIQSKQSSLIHQGIDYITHTAFSADGNALAVAEHHQAYPVSRIWTFDGRRQCVTSCKLGRMTFEISGVGLSSNGDYLAVATAFGVAGLSVFETTTGRRLQKYRMPKGDIRHIAVSSDGRSCAAAGTPHFSSAARRESKPRLATAGF